MRALILGITLLAAAQDPVAFDAASIKPSDPSHVGAQMYSPGPGRFRSLTATLRDLTAFAWHVRKFQVAAGEHWEDSEAYDIQAKAPHPFSIDELRSLVRALLADRFGLVVSESTREVPEYELTVGKGGPKMTKVDRAGPGVAPGKDRVIGRGANMATLAAGLSDLLDRPVVDRTGLDGFYDFLVKPQPDQSPAEFESSLLPEIEEQLGLKFVPAKGPVKFVVIDRANRPAPN